ncbi:MAG: extracellular solute-binding protein [Clostridiales bacterium]|jgi:putative aldouronate transport system substrate-binding protein|nr:extracellular solute-binding protein [Clostridiales bacterium]
MKAMAKILCVTLAALLAASAAACGNGAASSQAPVSNQGASGEKVTKYDPPITMSWAAVTSAVQQFKDGDTYENNIWSRKYLDELGIQLEVAFAADGSTGAYNDKLNMQLAAGDLPDIVHTYQYELFKQAYDAGYAADITDVYANYASDYLLECQKKYPDSFAYTSFDGRLHGISFFNNNDAGSIVLWIRDDWLEKSGKSAPKTMEELYELAKWFTFNDPDGNGKDDTYGLGLNKNLTVDQATIFGLIGGFGVPGDDIYYRGANGKLTYTYLEPGMKDALGFLHRLYADGILDPEFTVKDSPEIEADIASGKLGMAFGRQWGTWLPWNLALQNEDVVSHAYPIPAAEGYQPKLGLANNAGGEIFFVNAKFPYPEAFILMSNVFSDTYNINMTPEVSAIYADDEQYRFSPIVLNEPQEPVWGPILWDAMEKRDSSQLPARLLNHYTRVMAFEDGTDRGSEAYGLWGQYSIGGSVAICLDYVKNGMTISNIIGTKQPETRNEYRSILEDMTRQMFTDIIRDGNTERFEDYKTSWLAAGGQEILDELDSLYPAE